MKNKESVAIIVPIYNVEKYLKKCIDSIISQTYKNLEILLVDDGSPDNCGKICDDYAKKDKRIIVVHKENGGYGSVLEYAINHIKSKYFLICDSDDWLEEIAVEKLLATMKKNKVDIVVGGKNLVYNDGTIKNEYELEGKNMFNVIRPNTKIKNIEYFTALPCSPHSKLYKTEYAKNISFPKKISYTDALLYFVYVSRIKSGIVIKDVLSNYYIDRPGNSMEEHAKLKENGVKSIIIQRRSIIDQINKSTDVFKYILGGFIYPTAKLACRITKNMKGFEKYREELKNITIELGVYKKYAMKVTGFSCPNKIKVFIKNILILIISNKKTINLGLKLLHFKFK